MIEIIQENNTLNIRIGDKYKGTLIYSQKEFCGGEGYKLLNKESFGNHTFVLEEEGIYRLEVKGEYYDKTYYFSKARLLHDTVIADIERLLCGCACKDCTHCDEEFSENEFLSVLAKTVFFYTYYSELYEDFFKVFKDCWACELEEEAKCLILNERIYGNYDNRKAIKRLVAHFYLVFLYRALYFASAEEKVKIKERFKFEKIKRCIDKMGIETSCVMDKIFKIEKEQCFVALLDEVVLVNETKRLDDTFFKALIVTEEELEDFDIRIDGIETKTLSFKQAGKVLEAGTVLKGSDLKTQPIEVEVTDDKVIAHSSLLWSYYSVCQGKWVEQRISIG